MLKKILAAIDTPPTSRKVIDDAVLIAQSLKAELGLLYVLSPQEFTALPHPKFDQLEVYSTRLLDNSLKCYIGQLQSEHHNPTENPEFNLLQSYARYAIARGIATEFFQCIGVPGPIICEFAAAWQADLVMVGYRNRSRLAEIVLGSVCNYVAHHAPCSVYIVRSPIPTGLTGSHGMETMLH